MIPSEGVQITMRDVVKITICLAATCLLAGAVLGAAYYFTEPVRQVETAKSEAALVREMLALNEGDDVVEVRRYIGRTPKLLVAYLFPDELRLPNKKIIPVPKNLNGTEERDRWVMAQSGTTYVGRFFIGYRHDKQVAGYITESSHYGYKSPIRFFVALTPNFQVRGVEVVSHEEDPGLGAEITRPVFTNQFLGRTAESLPTLVVSKEPMPPDRRMLSSMPFEAWVKQYGEPTTPIYAVTGATISSIGLTEGVKEAVAHLKYRLKSMEGEHE